MAKKTRVVALQAGHDGRMFRTPGEEFDVDLDDKRFAGSDWFAPIDSPKVAEAAARKVRDEARAKAGIPPGAGPKPGSALEDDTPPGAGPKPGSAIDMV